MISIKNNSFTIMEKHMLTHFWLSLPENTSCSLLIGASFTSSIKVFPVNKFSPYKMNKIIYLQNKIPWLNNFT